MRTAKNCVCVLFLFASPKESFDFQEEEHSIIDWKIFKNQTRRQDNKKLCDKYKIGLKCDSDIFNLTKSVSLSTTGKNKKKTECVAANRIDNKQI